ncbi:MAG: cysteine desulfurase [Ruminococcaceae bacterium]|nr:cysteine desulfurase [Oscillospiraceae bacterium]
MEVYLDNAATTRPYDAVINETARVMREIYANPSSMHALGKAAEDFLCACRNTVAQSMGADEGELIFTAGGTEADNLAIFGYCEANKRRGNKIITTKTEHPAVLEAFSVLEDRGFHAIYLDVDEQGTPDLAQLKNELDENTILVSMMAVNNETGAILPIAEVGAMLDHSRTALHVDAVQGYGKIPLHVKKLGIDLMSVASHKIHGPRGVGALYVRKGVRIKPLLAGGKQEHALRAGTENLPGIAGFAEAVRIRTENMAQDETAVALLKERLLDGLNKAGANYLVNSPQTASPYVLNLSFEGIKSEVLLHVLESKGISVSTGSACNSAKNRLSYVLKAMGFSDRRVDGAVRLSFSAQNTPEEMDYVAQVLAKEAALLQKIMKR